MRSDLFISLVLFEQAVLEELRRESAERQRTLQEEIERLKIEKEEVTVDNTRLKSKFPLLIRLESYNCQIFRKFGIKETLPSKL